MQKSRPIPKPFTYSKFLHTKPDLFFVPVLIWSLKSVLCIYNPAPPVTVLIDTYRTIYTLICLKKMRSGFIHTHRPYPSSVQLQKE